MSHGTRPTLYALGQFWFRFGLISWGGMYAMLPRMEEDFATHGWLTREQFQEAMAVSTLVPGPTFVSLAGLTGYGLAGASGAAISIIAVMLPPTILVTAAMLLVTPDLLSGPLAPITRSLSVAVAGVLLGNAWRMAVRARRSAWRGPLVLTLTTGAILLGLPVALTVVGGILVSALLMRGVAA